MELNRRGKIVSRTVSYFEPHSEDARHLLEPGSFILALCPKKLTQLLRALDEFR